MAYHSDWIEAMLNVVEKQFETHPHPYLEDEYYGHEFMQYRVVKTSKDDEIIFEFCSYGTAGSFILADGRFFYEKDKDAFITMLGEMSRGFIKV